MATSLIPKSAGSHDAFVEPRCVRMTFGGRWSRQPAANALRKALTLAFPAVDFTLRYRTSQTFHPSWVEVSWHGAPSEADVHSALAGALHEMSAENL